MPKKKKQIYLDHAATTPVDSKVKKAMLPFWEDNFGNPSSLYKLGQEAKVAIENSRSQIAEILNSDQEEIIFTGSGTESCNLALQGLARAYKNKGKHIITSEIEHHAVLNTCKYLEKEGFDLTYLEPNEDGLIKPEKVKEALREETILVSIMYANNEIGTLEPISEIGGAIQNFKDKKTDNDPQPPFFHSDACQAGGYLDLNVANLNVDLLTLNGSKIYGPKGVGTLYKSKGIELEPIMYGGEQEFGLKPGTENVANFVGMGKALKLAQERKNKEVPRLKELRDYLIQEIQAKIERVHLNGPKEKRLPFNAHFTIEGAEGEAILLWLDKFDIYASTGSACTSSELEPSHVINAIGVPRELANGSLRLTLGKSTTKEDLDYTIKKLVETIQKLRSISPI